MEFMRGIDFEDYVINNLSLVSTGKVIIPKLIYSDFLKKFTQIDALLIMSDRIYCIEMKSASYLSGEQSDIRWWTSTSTNSSKKTVIYSPFLQNSIHIDALQQELAKNGFDYIPIENIIIVSDDIRLKTDCTNFYKVSEFMTKVEEDFTSHPNPCKLDVEGIIKVLI